MGLLKAGLGAAGGVMADQWKEYIYCESMPADVLACKGSKRTGGRSSNTRGEDNVISNGSVIAVNDGQGMLVVQNGKIIEVALEPGEFVFDTGSEPSVFSGNLGDSIKETFANIGSRFTFGGDAGKDQRVYYFNTKELIDNKFGTPNPIPFRVLDSKIGLDVDVSVRCSGVYSYKIADPILFYTNVCGNVEQEYTRNEIDSQLKTEFISALQPAFGRLSDLEMIKQAQRTAIMRDPTMAAATPVGAQADAMKAAASNEGGAMNGFIGMGMAMNAGGMNAQNLFAMGQQQTQQTASSAPDADGWKCACGATATGKFCPECGAKKPEPVQSGAWKCKCGAEATGKFCPECGCPKPAEDGWACSCGAVNKGKFCQNCGARKPKGAPLYRCDKCGWEPEDPHNPPKFCPECGDLFDDNDKK